MLPQAEYVRENNTIVKTCSVGSGLLTPKTALSLETCAYIGLLKQQKLPNIFLLNSLIM